MILRGWYLAKALRKRGQRPATSRDSIRHSRNGSVHTEKLKYHGESLPRTLGMWPALEEIGSECYRRRSPAVIAAATATTTAAAAAAAAAIPRHRDLTKQTRAKREMRENDKNYGEKGKK
uniref:Uncharacterized protein n=1 Tax=Vespula pensylvanica TaxID=30213 RepID=A0A834P955_VESPE|nr:hypothetical protein H0235_004844 [Vespula pensylvanica]